MKKTALLIIIPVIFLFNTCALEIANVIGPGGGYVFYDKGNYEGGWRYLECSPFDMCELKDIKPDDIKKAMKTCEDHSGGWYSFPWELPDEAQMKKMLECFSYGLTRFSPDYHYLAFNKSKDYVYDEKNPNDTSDLTADPPTWEAVILHKNFDKKANGEVERVEAEGFTGIIRVRPIRKF
jgi:hypothetical protein